MEVRKVLSEEDINKLDNYEDMFFKEIAWERAEEKFKKIVTEELKKIVTEEVKEEVKEEVEGNMVRKLLEDGFNVDDVLKYTNLNKSQVIALSNTIVLK